MHKIDSTVGWRRYLTFSVVWVAVMLGLLFICVSTVAAQEEISSATELQRVADDLGGEYVLSEDVDLSEISDFEPIGDSEDPFTGTFNGNGNNVSRLGIEVDGNGVGLFGTVGKDGTIKDVGVKNAEVNGGVDVGALVGNNQGEVRRSHSSGSITGEENTGGLVGRNIGKIHGSYSTASVSGEVNSGGLAGRNVGAVRRSYATGEVSGDDSIGGVVGYNLGDVVDTYATGSVTGRVTAGGVVGYNRGRAVIRTSYATARVDAEAEASGIVGLNSAKVEDSYYDVEATSEDSRFRRDPPGTGLTRNEMTGSNAERNLEGFNFEDTWQVESGYPTLVPESGESRNENGAEDGDEDDGVMDENGGDEETTDNGEGSGDENGATTDGEASDDDEGNGDDGESTEDGDDDGGEEGEEGLPGFGVFAGLLASVCAVGFRIRGSKGS